MPAEHDMLTLRRVIMLLSTSPEQELLPHAGNLVEVAVTIELAALDAQPHNILLDNKPFQIEAVDDSGHLVQQV